MSAALDYLNYASNYLPPKVPGINASTLQPSIGCDNWRTEAGQKRRRSAQYRKPKPISGRGTAELVPGNSRGPMKQRTQLRIDPVGTAEFGLLDYASMAEKFCK